MSTLANESTRRQSAAECSIVLNLESAGWKTACYFAAAASFLARIVSSFLRILARLRFLSPAWLSPMVPWLSVTESSRDQKIRVGSLARIAGAANCGSFDPKRFAEVVNVAEFVRILFFGCSLIGAGKSTPTN